MKAAIPAERVLTLCSWCHETIIQGPRYCPACRHRADLPRKICDCPSCLAELRRRQGVAA